MDLRLRRINRIRTVTGSLAIEGNTLSEEQITALLNGKTVLAPPRELQEARNALAVYERLSSWDGQKEADLLAAHSLLMKGLLDHPGNCRSGGVGVMAGEDVLHMASPANRVPELMQQLFAWLPVESLVHQQQAAYYQALNDSTAATDCAPFIRFMLGCIHLALQTITPQDTRQVTPQVKTLLKVLTGEMSRQQIQAALGLADRENVRKAYLLPALEAGLVEMTQPDRPNSKNQCYRLAHPGQKNR